MQSHNIRVPVYQRSLSNNKIYAYLDSHLAITASNVKQAETWRHDPIWDCRPKPETAREHNKLRLHIFNHNRETRRPSRKVNLYLTCIDHNYLHMRPMSQQNPSTRKGSFDTDSVLSHRQLHDR
jgi:hypothetical protein